MATLQQQKIRIRLQAFDRRLLDTSCEKIVDTANRTNATAIGPIPLPTKRRIYCLLRSPHVDKDSREHFETRTHRRIIDIYQPSSKTIDALMKLDLPSGVDIEVKLWLAFKFCSWVSCDTFNLQILKSKIYVFLPLLPLLALTDKLDAS